jgi:hypothetical protein
VVERSMLRAHNATENARSSDFPVDSQRPESSRRDAPEHAGPWHGSFGLTTRATIVGTEENMRTLLIVASLSASAATLAQGSGEPGGGARAAEFAALDRNRDGYVTRVEALADQEIHKRFAQFDSNKDRQLSLAEYLAAREDNEKRAQRDAVLTGRVKAALLAERGILSRSISVEAYEGRVQLSGFVPAPEMASRAGRITAAVSGVRTVHNNLVVK